MGASPPLTAYDAQFYDVIRAGARASAAVVAPMALELVDGRRVIDVGCGEGWWASEFEALGCGVLGVDGAYVTGSPIELARFRACDLNRELPLNRYGLDRDGFDLAVSLEVAEHLRPHRAGGFVAELCSLAPVVLFSAAIPGQGGTGHVNEQWPAYWVELFARHGYHGSGALRWAIWDDDRVENWYRQNLLVFVSSRHVANAALVELMSSPLAPCWPVVHPVLYDHARHR